MGSSWGKGSSAGESCRRAIGPHQLLGFPRRLGRVGRDEHPCAEPPQRAARGVMVQEPAARDDQAGGIVVELGEAVGRLGHEGAVVGAVAGYRAESLERHHRNSP